MQSVNWGNHQRLALTIGVGLVSAAAAYQLYKKLRGGSQAPVIKTSDQLVKSWKEVGRVTALHIFPIKSCMGVEVREAMAEPMGLTNGETCDRSFLVINNNNNFLHARLHPEMVLIKVSVEDGKVELMGPNCEPITFSIPRKSAPTRTVRVWGQEVTGLDCGDEAAQWLSRYIFKEDSGARLVYRPYSTKSPRVVNSKAGHPWMTPTDGAIFTDTTPFHLLSTESAEDLSSRLEGAAQVSTLNFRPTITISGCKPYEEDEWRFVRIGNDAVFRFVKCCDRCVLTTIDPATGIKHPESEPLRTLKKYRQADDPVLRSAIGESPLLGINLRLDRPGRIRVGDVVYAGQL